MALTVVTHGQQSLPQKEQALFRKCVVCFTLLIHICINHELVIFRDCTNKNNIKTRYVALNKSYPTQIVKIMEVSLT